MWATNSKAADSIVSKIHPRELLRSQFESTGAVSLKKALTLEGITNVN